MAKPSEEELESITRELTRSAGIENFESGMPDGEPNAQDDARRAGRGSHRGHPENESRWEANYALQLSAACFALHWLHRSPLGRVLLVFAGREG